MKLKLESIKPLDSNVERDGAKEIRYDKDSYAYLFEDDEFENLLKEMKSIDEDDKAMLDATRQTSNGIAQALAESEMSDEELMALWNKNDLGKFTINTPTIQKKEVEQQETQMLPVSELEFQEIEDSVDKVDAEMQKKFEEVLAELEGIF